MSDRPRLELALGMTLDAFELSVELGSSARVLGVFGPSGSGKSSLLEAIAGIRSGVRGRIALAGEVWLDDRRRIRLPPERRGVGFVPQDGLLFPHLSVADNLAYGSRRTSGDSNVGGIARSLGLEPLLARDVRSLSGGERQRVALGRALCSSPRLLLLDEPFGALDLPLRRSLIPFLLRVLDDADIPALLVSHDPVEVQTLCDDVVVLERGRVRARGEPEIALAEAGVWTAAGYDNTFVCTARGTKAMLDGGPELHVTPVGDRCADGDRALLVIPANDVLVAAERPRAISARNVLEASVLAIEPLGAHHRLVAELAPGGPALAAEITGEALAELGLEPGKRAYLVVKSSACRLYTAAR